MECVAINIIPSNKRNKREKKVEEEAKNSHFSFTKYVNNEHLACTGECGTRLHWTNTQMHESHGTLVVVCIANREQQKSTYFEIK